MLLSTAADLSLGKGRSPVRQSDLDALLRRALLNDQPEVVRALIGASVAASQSILKMGEEAEADFNRWSLETHCQYYPGTTTEDDGWLPMSDTPMPYDAPIPVGTLRRMAKYLAEVGVVERRALTEAYKAAGVE